MSACYRTGNGRHILNLHLQTGCREDGIGECHGGRLRVRVRARPVEGRANKGLIALLAKEFKVNKAGVSILSGSKSRYKTVAVEISTKDPAWLSALCRDSGCQ